MIMLALDQSSRVSGWSIYDNDKLIDFGHFSISSSLPVERKMNELMRQLCELHNKFEFVAIAFEDIQLQAGNVKTFKTLSYIQAAIIIWCYDNDMPYKILAPSHWRSILKDKFNLSFGRKRAEQKQVAQEFVQNKFNITVTEDEADSICLGLAAILEKDYTESNDECAF